MSTLYVTEPGARIRKEQGRLLVQVAGATRLEAPLAELERVLLLGPVDVTAAAVETCLAEGIDLVWMSSHGVLRGRLVGAGSKNVERRLEQYEAFRDPALRLALARAMVTAKIRNSLRLVSRYGYEHPEFAAPRQLEHLKAAVCAVRKASTLDELRGQEGRAAAAYFAALCGMVRGELTFTHRRRRPPPDPVNALLSLGYSLVGTELMGVLSAVGFDPYLGFLHEPRHGRFSLAQDLLEEFRAPAVDRLVLRLVNRRMVRPGHFHEEDGAVSLTKPGFAKFIAAYEAHLSDRFQHGGHETDLRRCFVAQAQALGRALRGEQEYGGHRWH